MQLCRPHLDMAWPDEISFRLPFLLPEHCRKRLGSEHNLCKKLWKILDNPGIMDALKYNHHSLSLLS